MMIVPTIAFIRSTSLLTDAIVRQYVAAQQIQIDRDYVPVWGGGARCLFIPGGHTVPPNVWQCALLDSADEAGALGFHDVTRDGLPVMTVGVGDAIRDGLSWTVTCSHEVLETLVDPDIVHTVPVTIDGVSYQYAKEIADASEDDEFSYGINGVQVSDFVYPSWFDPDGKAPFTFRDAVHAPFALAPGGYIGRKEVLPTPGQWDQVFADGAPGARTVKSPTSRTMRRFMKDITS